MTSYIDYIIPCTNDGKKLEPIKLGGDLSATRISETHNFGNEIVSQPLENGAQLVDHIIIEPDELEVVIHCSNVPSKNKIYDQFYSQFPSQMLYTQLKQIRENRWLCIIHTRHELYYNMAISKISAPNNAPFMDQVDFTVSFKRVDITEGREGAFLFEKLTYNFDVKIERKRLRQGYMPDEQTVYDSAKEDDDLGELPAEEIDYGWGEEALEPEDLDDVPTPEQKTSYSALQNIVRGISKAYEYAGNFTQYVSNLLQEVSNGIIFVTNLAEGVRTFYTTIKGQVVGIYAYFDVLTNDWHFNLTDEFGENMITGLTSSPNLDSLHGLRTKYKRVDVNDNVYYEDLAIFSLSMTEPLPSYSTSADSIYFMQDQKEYFEKYGKALKNEKGIESSIFAFTKDESGVAPCCYFLFSDKKAALAYWELLLGLVKEEQNFDFDDLDYSILIPPSTKEYKLEQFLRRLNGSDLPSAEEVPDDCEDILDADKIEQALTDINSDSIDFIIPEIPI